MQFTVGERVIAIELGDITKQTSDAIVNAANSSLMGGGGVDGAIHRGGGASVLEECKAIVSRRGRLPAVEAVATGGGSLPASHVIHTVGPVWHGGGRGEADILASAYRQSLRLAEELHLTSVAFPSISTGAYGYPVQEASTVALSSVIRFLSEEADSVTRVVFVLFDKATLEAYRRALQAIERS
jgi:O-acetyl-ADP-ribose deacetylase (regulator of RNase III)